MAEYEFPESLTIDPEIKELIKKILMQDPKKRISVSKIQKMPFMNPAFDLPKQLPISTLGI